METTTTTRIVDITMPCTVASYLANNHPELDVIEYFVIDCFNSVAGTTILDYGAYDL